MAIKLSYMSFSCPEASLDEFVGWAKQYGYEGVEPRAEANHNHGVDLDASPARRAAIKKYFEDEGVDPCCVATSRKFAIADKAELAEAIDTCKRLIDLAADVGSTRIRTFGGGPPEGMGMEDATQVVGESLAQLGPYAIERGVVICTETHDAFSRATDTAAVIKIANSPGVKANWDIMHPFTQGMTIDEAYEALKGNIEHCHIHDGTYAEKGKGAQLALMGEGDIPYPRAVELLEAEGFDGYLSGEWISAPWPIEELLPHDAQALRSYMTA